MTEPILVISDDVDLFACVADAERYLEAWQIGRDLFVFDATGRPLRAVVVNRRVRIEDASEAVPDIAALRAGLIRLIEGNERPLGRSFADFPLEALFARAQPYMTR